MILQPNYISPVKEPVAPTLEELKNNQLKSFSTNVSNYKKDASTANIRALVKTVFEPALSLNGWPSSYEVSSILSATQSITTSDSKIKSYLNSSSNLSLTLTRDNSNYETINTNIPVISVIAGGGGSGGTGGGSVTPTPSYPSTKGILNLNLTIQHGSNKTSTGNEISDAFCDSFTTTELSALSGSLGKNIINESANLHMALRDMAPVEEPEDTSAAKFAQLQEAYYTAINNDSSKEAKIAYGLTYIFDPVICVNLFEYAEYNNIEVLSRLSEFLLDIMNIMGLTINLNPQDVPYLIGDKVAYKDGEIALEFRAGTAMLRSISTYLKDYSIAEADIQSVLNLIDTAINLLKEIGLWK